MSLTESEMLRELTLLLRPEGKSGFYTVSELAEASSLSKPKVRRLLLLGRQEDCVEVTHEKRPRTLDGQMGSVPVYRLVERTEDAP